MTSSGVDSSSSSSSGSGFGPQANFLEWFTECDVNEVDAVKSSCFEVNVDDAPVIEMCVTRGGCQLGAEGQCCSTGGRSMRVALRGSQIFLILMCAQC